MYFASRNLNSLLKLKFKIKSKYPETILNEIGNKYLVYKNLKRSIQIFTTIDKKHCVQVQICILVTNVVTPKLRLVSWCKEVNSFLRLGSLTSSRYPNIHCTNQHFWFLVIQIPFFVCQKPFWCLTYHGIFGESPLSKKNLRTMRIQIYIRI